MKIVYTTTLFVMVGLVGCKSHHAEESTPVKDPTSSRQGISEQSPDKPLPPTDRGLESKLGIIRSNFDADSAPNQNSQEWVNKFRDAFREESLAQASLDNIECKENYCQLRITFAERQTTGAGLRALVELVRAPRLMFPLKEEIPGGKYQVTAYAEITPGRNIAASSK